MKKLVIVELTHDELRYLINDTIAYIWDIKKRIFGDDWNFGTDITEVTELSDYQRRRLEEDGYYSRKALLDRLRTIEATNFPIGDVCE